MFDLGIQELIVIFVVALLVFGPKRLPELSRALGKGIRELKMALRGVKDSFEEAEAQIEESVSKATQTGVTEEGKNREENTDTQAEQNASKSVGEGRQEKSEGG